MRASPSTARTRRHQLSHRLSCTSHTLRFLAQPLPLATSSQAPAAGAWWPGGLQGWAALGLCRQGRELLWPSSGPCLAWPQTWPLLKSGQTTEVHGLYTQGHVHSRKRHLFAANDFCLRHSPALLRSSAWAYCFTDHCTVAGEGRRGLLSGGDVQPVVLSTPYSPNK